MSAHAYLPATPNLELAAPSVPDAGRASVRTSDARLGLATVLAFAFGLRVWALFAFPQIHHPDEMYQAFEQAHRYAFGYGIKPWEFEIGLRSTLLPWLMSGLMRLAALLSADPAALIVLPRMALAALSLLPVAAIYLAGLRRSFAHAVVGGVVAATWSELVYFSYRPLTEALAADFLLTALALLTFRGPDLSRRLLVGLGACLGLVLMLRIHFAPAVAVLGLATLFWRAPTRLAWLAVGAAGPIATFGLADWIAWGVPFGPPLTAIRVNIGEGAASAFGVDPPVAYLGTISRTMLPVMPVVIVALVKCARDYRLWIVTAAVIVASHSAIPHKEYRFVFVCSAMLAIAAAFATVNLAGRLAAFRTGSRRARIGLTVLLATGWTLGSLAVASGDVLRGYWTTFAAERTAFDLLRREPDLCGILLDDLEWSTVPGLVWLHRDIPIYRTLRPTPAKAPAPGAYNAILSPIGTAVPSGYETLACLNHPYDLDTRPNGGICLLHRKGTCRADPDAVPLSRESLLGDPRPRAAAAPSDRR